VGKLVAALQAWGPAGVFVLAVIDSAGLPLPVGVDALLVTVAVLDRRAAWLAAALAVAGSMVGCLFLFFLARKGGMYYLDKHTQAGRGARLREWFRRYGLLTVFVPALLPVPLPVKVPILCAGALGVPVIRFAGVVAVARVTRYFGLAMLGAAMGDDALPWLRAHVWHLAVAALLVMVALYLLMRKLEGR